MLAEVSARGEDAFFVLKPAEKMKPIIFHKSTLWHTVTIFQKGGADVLPTHNHNNLR